MILVLFALGLIGGFLSGLLGLGGAIVMIPLMLNVPVLVGVGELSMRTVAGLSMFQVLFASLFGILIHRKNKCVHTRTFLTVGIPMGICALAGAYASKFIPNEAILAVFGVLIIVALIVLLVDKRTEKGDAVSVEDLDVSPFRSVLTGTVVGTLSGIVGAGGGFIMVPLMVSFLGIPLKITIGTSLGVVFIGALMGSIGKIVSLQVDFILALPLIVGSIVSARLGARVSNRLPSHVLKYALIAIVFVSGGQIVYKFFSDREKVSDYTPRTGSEQSTETDSLPSYLDKSVIEAN